MNCQENLITNVLPVPTWNRFAVNNTVLKASFSNKDAVFPHITALSSHVHLTSKKNESAAKLFALCPSDKAIAKIDADCAIARSISITKDANLKEPLIIDFSLPDKTAQCETFDISLGENSSCEIIFAYGSDNFSAKGDHRCLIRILAAKGAKLKLKTLNALGASFSHYEAILASLDDNAAMSLQQMVLGGKEALQSAYIELKGTGASSDISVNYLGHSEQKIDFNHVTRHLGAKSKSQTVLNGILQKGAKKTARATIDFVHGCKKASGNETENVLLLDKNIVNKSVPLILCDEDNVIGNHGTTIGSIDNQTLFYMLSRGLSQAEANKLFLDSLIEKCQKSMPESFSERIEKLMGDYDE